MVLMCEVRGILPILFLLFLALAGFTWSFIVGIGIGCENYTIDRWVRPHLITVYEV